MNRELAKKVADAVLYEGYMLYPYRPSAIKNRQRWTFGILYPPAYREVHEGTERAAMHSECLVVADGEARVQIQLRFLHLACETGGAQAVRAASRQQHRLWSMDDWWRAGTKGWNGRWSWTVAPGDPIEKQFTFSGISENSLLRDGNGCVIGNVSRTQHEVRGTVTASFQLVGDGVWKLAIDVRNETLLEAETSDRAEALRRSLLSAHTILTVSGGQFVSLLDPQLGTCVNRQASAGTLATSRCLSGTPVNAT